MFPNERETSISVTTEAAMPKQKVSVFNRIKNIGFAWEGLTFFIASEYNARIHIIAAVVAVTAGFIYKISKTEWIAVVFAIGLMFSLEIVNTSIEHIANFVSPERRDAIKKIKDLASAAVLVGAFAAFVVALIIFIPKII